MLSFAKLSASRRAAHPCLCIASHSALNDCTIQLLDYVSLSWGHIRWN